MPQKILVPFPSKIHESKVLPNVWGSHLISDNGFLVSDCHSSSSETYDNHIQSVHTAHKNMTIQQIY